MSRFEAAVRQRSGVAVVDLRGELDAQATGSMRDAYAAAAALAPRAILLRFEDVGYVTSSGIAVVVDLLLRARRDGRELTACALSDHYRKIFELTRLVDFVRVFPDEEDAIVALGGGTAAAKAAAPQGEVRADGAGSREADRPADHRPGQHDRRRG